MQYENGEHGYVLEVDLGYPTELHDLHSDYPLAPENMCVTSDMVSDFNESIHETYHKGKEIKYETAKKLILNVQDKTNYVVHISNLKYYSQKGLVLKRVSRCTRFKHSNWLQ